MTDSLIPRKQGLGGASVNVNTGGGHPGFGATPPGAQQQSFTTPGAMLRQYLSGQGGGGGATSSFNWKSHNGGLESSETLGKMLNGAEVDDKSTKEYYIDKVAQFMFHFSDSIMRNKHQTYFFQHFIEVRDNFVVDQQLQTVCAVKKDFVESIIKVHDFKRVVGFNGSIVFGYMLIDQLKKTGADDWTEREVHSACQLAVSHIMSFEFVNWLVNTKKGRTWHNRLPPNVDRSLGNLEGLKDQFAEMWEMFDVPFPYANLSFAKTTSAPMEYHRVFNPNEYGDTFGRIPGDYNPAPRTDNDSVLALVARNAQLRKRVVEEPRQDVAAAQYQDVYNEVGITVNTIRYDFPNINPQNMDQFDWRKEFRPIGKENHYWVCESSWLHIQKLFNRHPEQRQEEAVGSGVFRVIVIDLDGARSWNSFTVRNEKLTVQYVMSNPERLLPLLEKSPDEDAVYAVQVTPVEMVDVANKLEVPIEMVKELGEGIPVIAVNQTLVATSTQELLTNVDLTTISLTKNLKGTSAISFNLGEWDTYSLKPDQQNVKVRMIQDLPFLFNDSGEKGGKPSMYQVGRKLIDYFNENILPEGLAKFINARLMNVVNEWLVNEMGYNVLANKGGGGKLQISNFVADLEDLNGYLKAKDPMAYELFHDGSKDNYLTKGLKIFYYNNPFGVDPDEMEALDRLKSEITLYVVRDIFMVNVVGDKGPLYSEENAPVYVRRSVWPEIFRMIEDAFDKTTENNFDTTDKVIRYGESGNLWLFSYTNGARNVATLRHISNGKPLVLMAQN